VKARMAATPAAAGMDAATAPAILRAAGAGPAAHGARSERSEWVRKARGRGARLGGGVTVVACRRPAWAADRLMPDECRHEAPARSGSMSAVTRTDRPS
jgi:hypothetical protein